MENAFQGFEWFKFSGIDWWNLMVFNVILHLNWDGINSINGI